MELNKKILIGIEYVNDKALATVICTLDEVGGNLEFLTADNHKDADELIKQQILSKSPYFVFINAPTSMPRAFSDDDGEDFFFRECDKKTNCPSPMLNGELLARTIRLKRHVRNLSDIKLMETYPAFLAKKLDLTQNGWGKDEDIDIRKVLRKLQDRFEYPLDHHQINTRQHLNALLCLISALRYKHQESESFGNADEGLIIV